MKRDMDLVRAILLACEAAEDTAGVDIAIEGFTAEQVSYHIELMNEAELLLAIDMSTRSRSDWRPVRLTWAGHEFLDASRNDTAWAKAKGAAGTAGSMAFEVLKNVLINYGTQQASRLMGVPQ